ncbi:MAG TPA: cytochrome C oxidase subunit IV family protein [Candidatus Binatia bacterium]
MTTAEAHAQPNYMGVFWWLLGLTIAEVAVANMSMPKLIVVILLVGMAFTKAAMVALYFMHLKFERATLTWIALTPLILCIFLSLMLLPDIHP